MNPRMAPSQPEPLAIRIARHLDAAPEAPLKAIAKAVGEADYPGRVVKELNAMRTNGDIECERKKGELLYWLAKPLAAIVGTVEAPAAPLACDLPDGIREGTRAAQIWRVLTGPMTARQVATATQCAAGQIDPVLSAMAKAGQLTRVTGADGKFLYSRPTLNIIPIAEPVDFARAPELQYLAPKDYDMPPADPALLASAHANRMLHDRLDGVAHALVGCGMPELTGVTCHGDLPTHVATLAGAYQTAIAELAGAYQTGDEFRRRAETLCGELAALEQKRLDTTTELTRAMQDLDAIRELLAPLTTTIDGNDLTERELATNIAALVGKLQHLLDTGRHETEALRAEVERLRESTVATVESFEPEAPLDALDAAQGYLVKAPKRRPRLVSKFETAIATAKTAASNGSGRGEVFALIRLGAAKRGAVWQAD